VTNNQRVRNEEGKAKKQTQTEGGWQCKRETGSVGEKRTRATTTTALQRQLYIARKSEVRRSRRRRKQRERERERERGWFVWV
jgi:hypothetical protein